MEIFYIDKSEFLQHFSLLELEKYSDGRKYKSQEKYLEHLCGLYLVKNIAMKIYNIKNTDIEIISDKPFFKSRELYFSVSHSKNIVAVAFSKYDIGLDVEFIKKRDFKSIMNHYNFEIENPSAREFYKFWTLHEAEIKLGQAPVSKFSIPMNDEYYLSCVSSTPLISSFEIVKLKPNSL